MFDWIRYRRELSQIKKGNSRDTAPHRSAYWEARQQNKSKAEMDDLWEKLSDQVEANRDRIALLETNYLVSKAEKSLLPIPEISDATQFLGAPDPAGQWRSSKHTIQTLLTDKGIRELRQALRADRRERLEIVRSWVATIVPGLTGLIGVIIGLLAVILGRR